MVKGVARHAVIVKSPELKDFEQAIFIMSGPGDAPQVKSQSEMLSLACHLAGNYTAPPSGKLMRAKGQGVLTCAMWFFAGSAAACAVMWALGLLATI